MPSPSRFVPALLALALAACADTDPPQVEPDPVLETFASERAPDLDWTTPTGLRATMMSDTPPIVVDVRAPSSFAERHIEGARNLSLDRYEAALDSLPSDRWLVLYCACPDDAMAIMAARTATERGRDRVAILAGGIEAWDEAGYPTAEGES